MTGPEAPASARLAGRVALVTGAASPQGIGFAIARRMAREGARVVLTDIDADAIAARGADLAAEGHDALALAHDVAEEDSWHHVLAAARAWAGRLDILVNNAGLAILRPLAELSATDFDRTVGVNLRGPFLGCKLALPLLTEGTGAIVNISSVAGLVGVAGTTAYGATKGGIRLLTKSVAIEAAPRGIRVNSVHPGAVWTAIQLASLAEQPELFAGVEADIPLGRIADPTEIAGAVCFLASAEASYVTGAELAVDGGYTAW